MRQKQLFQRRIYRIEIGVERGADAVNRGEDHNAQTRRDQAILDRRRAGFVAKES
jgi:hypothetical protein